ncbi:hypothetical protein HKX48_005447 [Thoreauomyces humboldtii]|nr:hypothetical protein HKX48_005447 [Thoreauomyces humboldtii]
MSQRRSTRQKPTTIDGPSANAVSPVARRRRPLQISSDDDGEEDNDVILIESDEDGSDYAEESNQRATRTRGKGSTVHLIESHSDESQEDEEDDDGGGEEGQNEVLAPRPARRTSARGGGAARRPAPRKRKAERSDDEDNLLAPSKSKRVKPTHNSPATRRLQPLPRPPSPDDVEEDKIDVDPEAGTLASTIDLARFNRSISGRFKVGDMSMFPLKADHMARPLWVYGDGRIILEAFSPISEHAQDFLIAVAEPVTRPGRVHEYRLTEYSLYAAVSVGLETAGIIEVLARLSKGALPSAVEDFVTKHTASCGKVKVVLKRNRYWIESADEMVLRKLLRDRHIRECMVAGDEEDGDPALLTEHAPTVKGVAFRGFDVTDQSISSSAGIEAEPAVKDATNEINPISDDLSELAAGTGFYGDASEVGVGAEEDYSHLTEGIDLFELFDFDPDAEEAEPPASEDLPQDSLEQPPSHPPPDSTNGPNFSAVVTIDNVDEEEAGPGEESLVKSFEISKDNVDKARKRCSELSYPTLEEYDFRQDAVNPNLDIDLKASTQLRPYQMKSLSKMFGNGRARSGIIVLPCGAGKTLVGVTAACTIKKSCLVLCTSAVSVEQWAREFRSWSTVKEGQVAKFTSDEREKFVGDAGIMISTYSMMSFTGKRAYDAQKMIDFIRGREWGFLLLDEVHVVPAETFTKVLTLAAAHAKLGLTATLLREDDKIGNLNYLIGPKLYEANWLDLARKGHIASVECSEVWCPMTTEFYREYLREKSSRKKQSLFVMNPRKLQACQFLIEWHESRGDKVIVFSDSIFALKHYATKLNKPYICGSTSAAERLRILQQFQHNPAINTVFLSKVGDTSIDIPEATCLIQVSSHYGSRRQEAQRLGRILRAKKRSETGFNAYFYTLVSKDTEEVFYAAKRQQFLIDQGYHFKIITRLEGLENMPDLIYPTRAEQLELLNTVLVTGDMDDDELPSEGEQYDFEAVTRAANKGNKRRRARAPLMASASGGAPSSVTVTRTSTLQSISGGDSMAYIEYSSGSGTTGGPPGVGRKQRKGFFPKPKR